ncbi:MAG: lytic transglycosylase domain-containing protein [Thiotrichales bacterium]
MNTRIVVQGLSFALAWLLGSLSIAYATEYKVYKYRQQDGSYLFTDRRTETAELVGVKYFGRPAAVPENVCLANREALRKRQQEYAAHIERYASHYQLEPRLVRAVITAESCFNPKAVSPVGAQGLMQLMPGTAKDLGVNDPFDPQENIHGGVRYLRMMLDTFEQDIKLALAAYNAGPQAVKKYGGVPPFKETQTYVKKIMGMLQS